MLTKKRKNNKILLLPGYVALGSIKLNKEIAGIYLGVKRPAEWHSLVAHGLKPSGLFASNPYAQSQGRRITSVTGDSRSHKVLATLPFAPSDLDAVKVPDQGSFPPNGCGNWKSACHGRIERSGIKGARSSR